MKYTRLSVTEVRAALYDVARDAQATFGELDARQLNWRPGATQWSVAQCFQHLLTANTLILRAADTAFGKSRRSVWQRLPLLPALFGSLLIRSQAPNTRGKFTAPVRAQPTASEIPADIIQRFVDEHLQVVEWMQPLDAREASRTIMVCPFTKVGIYSDLDGLRLVVVYGRPHFYPARRRVA